jgi:hypothetical protein
VSEWSILAGAAGKDRVLIASPTTWSSSWVKSTTYTEFQVSTVGNDFVLKASTPAVAKKWVKLLSQRIEYAKTLSPASAARGDQNAVEEHHDGVSHADDASRHTCLLTHPSHPSQGLRLQSFGNDRNSEWLVVRLSAGGVP